LKEKFDGCKNLRVKNKTSPYLSQDVKKRSPKIKLFIYLKISREFIQMNKERKRRLEELAGLSLLTSSIIHDIRNYLTAIKGNAEIGAQITSDIKAKDKFLKIVELVNQASDMVEAFRKLYKAKGDLGQEDFYISDSVEFARKILGKKLSGINFEVDIPEIKLKGERKLIDQVFINLISNAADALENSPEKTIKIFCREKNNKLSIFIADSGPGIPDDIRKKIFDPFFTTKEGGTGMGLYIVKKILSRIGGKIRLLNSNHLNKFMKKKDYIIKENLENMRTIFEIILPKEVVKDG
jgi:signal transduction histidine kinase